MRIQWGKRKLLPRVMCAIQDDDSHVTWHLCAWERTCDTASVCRSKGYTYYRSEMTSWVGLKQIEKTPLSIMFTLCDVGCRYSCAFRIAIENNDPVAQTPNMFSDGRWVRATEFRLLSRMPESLFVGHYLATTKVSNKEQQILCTRETCLGSALRDHFSDNHEDKTSVD